MYWERERQFHLDLYIDSGKPNGEWWRRSSDWVDKYNGKVVETGATGTYVSFLTRTENGLCLEWFSLSELEFEGVRS